MTNYALFWIGVLVTIPTAITIVALVFAAGIDERAEKKKHRVPSQPDTVRTM